MQPDGNALPGWFCPVRQSLAEPRTLLMLGVPQVVGACIIMATILCMLVWWKGLFVGLIAYGIACAGTAYEVQWWEMIMAYRRYGQHYEG